MNPETPPPTVTNQDTISRIVGTLAIVVVIGVLVQGAVFAFEAWRSYMKGDAMDSTIILAFNTTVTGALAAMTALLANTRTTAMQRNPTENTVSEKTTNTVTVEASQTVPEKN